MRRDATATIELGELFGEPRSEGGVVVEVVLVAAEAEFAAGGDVLGEVVDVEGCFGFEVVELEGGFVDGGFGFEGTDFVGEDAAIEEVHDGVGLLNPGAVDDVDVGEEEEAQSGGFHGGDGLPHGLDGLKDGTPGVAECAGATGEVEFSRGPTDEFIFSDFS